MSGVARGVEASMPFARLTSLVVRTETNLQMPFNSRLGQHRSSSDQPSTRAAAFLDRDGVIVEDVHFLRKREDLHILPGVVDALYSLQEQFYTIVVTNQSGVARGLLTEDDLMVLHSELVRRLSAKGVVVDAIYYCPHLPGAPIEQYRVVCDCRKPAPGMFLRARHDWGIDMTRSFTVGDNTRDVEAGRAAGVRGILLRDKKEAIAESAQQATDLLEASRLILEHGRTRASC